MSLFQSWESVCNLKFQQSYSLKALCHQPSGYLHSGREDGSPSDSYFLKWLWCTYNKLLLRTLQHKAPTCKQMNSPAAGPASLASTEKKSAGIKYLNCRRQSGVLHLQSSESPVLCSQSCWPRRQRLVTSFRHKITNMQNSNWLECRASSRLEGRAPWETLPSAIRESREPPCPKQLVSEFNMEIHNVSLQS